MEVPLEAKSPIYTLANELLHQIYDFCPVNAKLCIEKCCGRFYDCFLGTVHELYEDLNRTLDFGNARFDRLCLDGTHTGSKTKKRFCSVCQRVHRSEEFAEEELVKDPRERVCKDSQGVLDLTPGSHFTKDNHFMPGISFCYQQLLHSRNAPLPLPVPYDEGFTFRLVENESRQWMIIMNWTCPVQYPRPPAWKDDLRHWLENLPVCTCSHMISSEPQFLQAVTSYWDDGHPTPAFVRCSTCDTKVEFALPTRVVGSRETWAAALGVSFHVERRLGKLGASAVDPRWKAQSLPLSQM